MHILKFYCFHSFAQVGMKGTFGRRFIILLKTVWSTHNRRFTKNCMTSNWKWYFLLWGHSPYRVVLTNLWFHCFATLSLMLDIGFSYIVGSPLFTSFLFNFLQPCNMLRLSEILSESTLTFPVGVTKPECCMYIMLVRCEVPAPVKVSLRKLSMPAIWIPGLPIPSTVGQIDAFSRSQSRLILKMKNVSITDAESLFVENF